MVKKGRFNITPASELQAVAASAAPERKMGRPKGKRSDDAFGQVSAWIRKGTYGQVRIRLLELGGRKEFSVLVQELLEKWLSENPRPQ